RSSAATASWAASGYSRGRSVRTGIRRAAVSIPARELNIDRRLRRVGQRPIDALAAEVDRADIDYENAAGDGDYLDVTDGRCGARALVVDRDVDVAGAGRAR